MFDTAATITIGLRVAGAGKTDITVRWPSDEEWAMHRKRSKLMMRQMGRGASEMETDSSAADQKMYEAIKLNGAPPLTAGEATTIIQAIGKCDVLRVDLGADEAEAELQILTGRVTHTVRIPTLDEVRKLHRTTRYLNLPYNCQEVRTSMEAAAALWDACGGKADGYAGAVPILHKDSVIRQVIIEIERETAASYGEENF
ncbi:MAG TPA: hypothetical protein VE030_11265 [Burkholderiales bacterium]|nr:hypothetical protein [Burkholderiales bacterium]